MPDQFDKALERAKQAVDEMEAAEQEEAARQARLAAEADAQRARALARLPALERAVQELLRTDPPPDQETVEREGSRSTGEDFKSGHPTTGPPRGDMARLYRPGREGGIFKGRPPRFVGWRVFSTGMTIAADGSIDLLPSLLAGEGLRISRFDDSPLVYSSEAVIGRAIEAIAVYLTHLARE